MTRLSRFAAVFLLLLLTAAPVAAAETPVLPEDFSAADQYVESVPTSGGPKPAKKETGKQSRAGRDASALVPPAVQELDGTLAEVATSPDLGAPERKLPDAKADTPSVPSATVSAIDDADGGRLLWLLLALAAVSAAIAGTATYRHRARRRATDS